MEHIMVGKVVLGRPFRVPGEAVSDEEAQFMALRRHLLGATEALEKLLKKKVLDK